MLINTLSSLPVLQSSRFRLNTWIKRTLFEAQHRTFTVEADPLEFDDLTQEVEQEFEEYCEGVREFVVLDRSNEAKNLASFLTRLSLKNFGEYLTRFNTANLRNLRNLEKYANALYTSVCCGYHANPDEVVHLFHELYTRYSESLSNTSTAGDPTPGDSTKDNTQFNKNDRNQPPNPEEDDYTARFSTVFGSVVLSYCEMGLFRNDLKKVSEVMDSLLFGDMLQSFLRNSSGKLINSALFLYSVTEFFEKDYEVKMMSVYDQVLQTLSKKETSMELSDIYYLKLSTKLILTQNPSLLKTLSKESMSFLTNVALQDYIREKEMHGLEDAVPAKIKEIDTNVEGGVFNIGPFTFTHVSLPNKNVYLLNKPDYYFNSSFKFGKREYLNWMDSFLRIQGWNLRNLFLCSPPKSPRNIFFPWQNLCVHRSGAFLERNRLALRVPINLTKFEIREYLRKLYNAKVIKVNTLIKIPKIKRDFSSKMPRYYRNGPMYKKAIVTLEHAVPDEVKMLGMDFELGKNPAITKKNISYGKKSDLSYLRNRKNDPFIGEYPEAWKLPVPNFLAEDDWEMNPELNENDDYRRMKPDPMEPHTHGGSYTLNRKPEEVPSQQNYMIDLTPWRRRLSRISPSSKPDPLDSEEAKPTPWNYPPPH